jgi:alanyl-tRNA synthetase
MTASQIRQQFLDFFKSKQHTIVPSAPIVIKNDPTLLFTNAGMNQFKDYFLGNKIAVNKRVADTQKCLRVSGKQNDLEEVGVDTYHHTMFEMLGNWSFGDYFKAEAIAWSWEFLTEVIKLDKNRLYVTVFEGDVKENLQFDQEAYNEWCKYIDPKRILKGNKKDNFWEMGDTGPCGPCSEIHVDCRSEKELAEIDGATLVNADHPQVIEIWNNVFMEFNRLKDGSLQALPAKHIDTGMGFERLVRVVQGKTSNYDTDIFTPTIAAVEAIINKKYDASDSKEAVAFRVLADHIRAIAFTITDGQLPSNTGAGYVIRRILRRAVRYYYSHLEYKQPLLYQLIPLIASQYEIVFPELNQQADFVTKVIKEEEEAFLRTLEKGLRRIDDVLKVTKTTIAGKDAFELYDTYGFPLDLTRLIAQEQGKQVDEEGFDAEMKIQKTNSRAATVIDATDWIEVHPADHATFVGYDDLLIDTKVLKYRKVKAKGKEQFQVVLHATPFYAESGGQVGDVGTLKIGDEIIAVTDTKKDNSLIIHFTDTIASNMDANVTAKVNWETRICTAYNHTATHLLHSALRSVLGTHVAQKGSLVNNENLRFDFSHFSKMSEEELAQVNQIVNKKIRENIPVVIKEMPKEEAMQLGAMALFGEKYGDTVRVVTIDPNYSVELCGGTHIGHTGMIGLFAITSEAAVASGVRRIEALTGPAAIHYIGERLHQHKQIAELLKSKDPLKSLNKLVEDKNRLEKRIEALEQKELSQLAQQLSKQFFEINDVNFIAAQVQLNSVDAIRKLGNLFKVNMKNYFVLLQTIIEGKVQVMISIDETLVKSKGWDASKLIKEEIAPLINGGGGGQKFLAIAGGQDHTKWDIINEKIRTFISK